MARKGAYSDKEVLIARAFCIAAGIALSFAGSIVITHFPTREAMIGGGVLAALGVVLAFFGLLGPRAACVGMAGWIFTLFG